MLPKSLTSALTLRSRFESYSRFFSHLKCVIERDSTNVYLGKCETQPRMPYLPLTPVAGPIFETKNRAIFLERFFGRGITAREQLSRAKNSLDFK